MSVCCSDVSEQTKRQTSDASFTGFVCLSGATDSAFSFPSELKVYFSLSNFKAVCVSVSVCGSCFAEPSLSFFVDMVRCGLYWVLGGLYALGFYFCLSHVLL